MTARRPTGRPHLGTVMAGLVLVLAAAALHGAASPGRPESNAVPVGVGRSGAPSRVPPFALAGATRGDAAVTSGAPDGARPPVGASSDRATERPVCPAPTTPSGGMGVLVNGVYALPVGMPAATPQSGSPGRSRPAWLWTNPRYAWDAAPPPVPTTVTRVGACRPAQPSLSSDVSAVRVERH